MKNKPIVSVIITTKNSEKFIRNCICSVKASSYYGFGRVEIIVVDNFSDDKTRKIAQHYGARVFKKGNERSAQRNWGVKKSKGKYILILDVDMTINHNLIKHCVHCMQAADGLYVHEKVIGGGFWVNVRNYERSFYDGTRIDAIRFFKRKNWIPFDEQLCGAEDWDWDRRFEGTKAQAYTELYHNEAGFSLTRYVNKKRYYSQWMKIYKQRYGNCPELNPLYRYFGVFIENGKWRKIVKHPVLFMATLFLRVVVGVNYLCVKKY